VLFSAAGRDAEAAGRLRDALNQVGVAAATDADIAAGKTVVPLVMTERRLFAGLPAPLRRWQFSRAGRPDAAEVAGEIKPRLMQLPASAA